MVRAVGRGLLRSVVAPVAEAALNPGVGRLRRRLAAFEWADPDEIRRVQGELLGQLLEQAYATVPYYRDVFIRLGLQPRDIGPQTLYRLPILDRKTLRREFPQGLVSLAAAAGRRSLPVYQTAGTTAAPVNFHLDPSQVSFDRATLRWLDSWAGSRLGDRVAHVQRRLKPRSRRVRFWRWLSGTEVLPAEPVMARDGESTANWLNRRRPDVIMGHPSMLRLAALALGQTGHRLHFRPKAVIYHSEQMDPGTRELVADVFGAPLHTRYGASEFACWIAQSCPDRVAAGVAPDEDLHIHALRFLVEAVDPEGRPVPPGEPGRLVVTDLGNRVMPLIRYDLGDLGRLAPKPCPCGRGLPVLKTLEGRTVEYVLLPSGRRLPGRYLSRSFRGDALWEYQVAQPDRNHLVASVVPFSAGYGEADKEMLIQRLKENLGEPMEIEVRVVREIPRAPSGKKPFLKPIPGQETDALLAGLASPPAHPSGRR